jgi:hypothetical protein
VVEMKKEALILTILLIHLAVAEDVRVYNIEIEIFKNETVKINQIKAIVGKLSDFPSLPTGYTIQLHSPSKTLWKANLPVKFYINLEGAGRMDLEKAVISMNIPYFSDAKAIAIYHGEKQIASFELKDFVCNKNNICELGENAVNCQEDCGKRRYIYLFFIFGILLSTLLAYTIIKLMSSKHS